MDAPTPPPFALLRPPLILETAPLSLSLAPSPSGPPPHPFCLLRHPHHSPYLSPGPPPPLPLSLPLPIYLSISPPRNVFIVCAAAGSRRSRARHTVAVCPLSLQSHPLYSRLLHGAALSRESVLTGVLLFLRGPTRLRSQSARLSESRDLSRRVFCARNNLHRTRSCEIEPLILPSRSPCPLAPLAREYLSFL